LNIIPILGKKTMGNSELTEKGEKLKKREIKRKIGD